MSRLDHDVVRGDRSPDPQGWQLIVEHVIRWPGATNDELARYADRSAPYRLSRAGLIESAPVYRKERSLRAWYLAGEAPRRQTIIDGVVTTIEMFPGATIQDIAAWLRADGITFEQVVTAMQGVSRHGLAVRRGWNPSRWYKKGTR